MLINESKKWDPKIGLNGGEFDLIDISDFTKACQWSECTKTCGRGIKIRHGKPSISGNSCEGDTYDRQPCNIHACE